MAAEIDKADDLERERYGPELGVELEAASPAAREAYVAVLAVLEPFTPAARRRILRETARLLGLDLEALGGGS